MEGKVLEMQTNQPTRVRDIVYLRQQAFDYNNGKNEIFDELEKRLDV